MNPVARTIPTFPLRRRGVATLFVVLALSVSAVVLLSVQGSAFRQAGAGRRAVAEVRAKWAARAGLESCIARLGHVVEGGPTGSAFTASEDMIEVSSGSLEGVRWSIEHFFDGRTRVGPAGGHARVNVSRMTVEDLLELSGMTEDVAAAILDWVDDDDEVRDLGAESSAYIQAGREYVPRNGPIRSLFELDLIRGVDPADVRGEDWNLNGVLDPNEDDGDLTWPDDDSDGKLDAGWSAYITAESVDEGLAASGEPRLVLFEANEQAIIGRVEGLSRVQSRVILAWAKQEGALMTDFIQTPLTAMAAQLNDPTIPVQAVTELTDAALRDLLDEATLRDPDDGPAPGRLDLNTCSRDTLRFIGVFRSPQGSGAADLLIFRRDQLAGGFTHIMDLADIMSPQQVAAVAADLDVQTNSYVVTSRGIDTTTGIEVEVVATIERTAQPITITEYHIR